MMFVAGIFVSDTSAIRELDVPILSRSIDVSACKSAGEDAVTVLKRALFGSSSVEHEKDGRVELPRLYDARFVSTDVAASLFAPVKDIASLPCLAFTVDNGDLSGRL